VRRALVAAEFALATPLLVAATLVAASLDRLTRVPVGIDMTRVLTANVSLPAGSYSRDADREAFWKRAVSRMTALPGVDAVAIADSRPPSESGQQNNFDLEDRPAPNGRNQPVCTWVGVSTEFFATVGLRLERGRLLDEHSPPGKRRPRRLSVGEPVLSGPGGSWVADSTRAGARRVRGRP
jgi:hypothetical protein